MIYSHCRLKKSSFSYDFLKEELTSVHPHFTHNLRYTVFLGGNKFNPNKIFCVMSQKLQKKKIA